MNQHAAPTSASGKENMTWVLVDEERGFEFPINSWASVDSSNSDGILDVFALFDIMTEYVKKSHYSVLWAVDADLGEELGVDSDDDDDDDDEDSAPYAPVLGRACGNRVCVVSTRTHITLLCVVWLRRPFTKLDTILGWITVRPGNVS